MEVLRKGNWRYLAKLFLKQIYGTVARENSQAEVLGAVWAMLGAVESVCPWCCMQLPCTSCLAKLFLKLLHGTGMQKLLFEAISSTSVWNCCAKVGLGGFSQGKMSISIPWRCNVFLSDGRGLGRSLSYVGRSQISLCVMLRAALVHKLSCEAIFWALAWKHREKLPFDLFCKLLFGTVEQTLTCKAISQGEIQISISRMLRCARK